MDKLKWPDRVWLDEEGEWWSLDYKDNGVVEYVKSDALERLESELDEAREAAAFHEHNWQQERDLKIGIAAELATIRARLAKMEEALRCARDQLAYMLAGPFGTMAEARAIATIDAALTEEQP